MRSVILRSFLIGLVFTLACAGALSDSSEALHPIPQDKVAAYLDCLADVHVFDLFEGQNEALKAAATDATVLRVAAGFPVDMTSTDLFREEFLDGDCTVHLAGVSSIDAEALRLRVDLAKLRPDEELWVIDPTAPRAFGPYGSKDYLPGGRWLPTIVGDMAVLMVRSRCEALPEICLKALSHFYWSLATTKAELTCHLNVACEDEVVRDVATGVGFMVLPTEGDDMGVCSGCLIDSAVGEPYFLTANHCVPGVVQAWNVEIVWDFRKECGSEQAPSISSLPRSSGVWLLENDNQLDGSLMLLDKVPGTRTYLDWDTGRLEVGDPVITLHHPVVANPGSATPDISTCFMRLSKGNVVKVDTVGSDVGLDYQHETKVLWDEGVTEMGSSGACLLFWDEEDGYQVAGTLSGGTIHDCNDPSNNYDYYASFRHFFPKIEGYLTGAPPSAPTDLQASDGTHVDFVRVTWDSAPGATRYLVYRSTADAIDGNLEILTESHTQTTYDDTVPLEDTGCFCEEEPTRYYYWVRARNSDGDSGFSEPDQGYAGSKPSLFALRADPAPPAGLQAALSLPTARLGDILVLMLAGVVLWAAGSASLRFVPPTQRRVGRIGTQRRLW